MVSKKKKWLTAAAALCVLIPVALQARKNATLTPADYEEIRNLYARYSHAFDSGDGHGLAAVYTVDGVFILAGKVLAEGRDQFIAQPRPPAPGKPSMRHLPANIALEPSSEGAKGRAYVFLVAVEAGKPPAISGGGTYEDVIVRTAEGWRFKRRDFTPFGAPPAATR